MKHIFYAAGLLLGLAACHPQSPPDTEAAARLAAKQPADEQSISRNSPGASYDVYRGLLPGQTDSITLHLITNPQPRYDAEGVSRYGSYYDSEGRPYEVQALSSNPDRVVLTDLSLEHSHSASSQPEWHLKQQPTGDLAGTDASGRPLRLRLVPPLAGSLTFAVRCFTDSLVAYPQKPAGSPRARISLQALVPTGGPASLAANMLRDLRGDTLGGRATPTLPALYQQQREAFFKEYRETIAEQDASADTAALTTYRATMSYEEQAATTVLFNQGNLLSLGFFSYSYSGGAHGANGTIVASYDLRTGRRLRYGDIFVPGAAVHLPALLAQAVRPLVGLKPDEPLAESLFVTKMPVTHNVFLTAGGAVFVYEPYEIASYAQGEVRVFVPLAQLRPLLRAGLPLPTTAGVAAR